jgi:hypothetical protein
VLNKSDQVLPAEIDHIVKATFGGKAAKERVHIASCTDGIGVDALINALADTVKSKYVQSFPKTSARVFRLAHKFFVVYLDFSFLEVAVMRPSSRASDTANACRTVQRALNGSWRTRTKARLPRRTFGAPWRRSVASSAASTSRTCWMCCLQIFALESDLAHYDWSCNTSLSQLEKLESGRGWQVSAVILRNFWRDANVLPSVSIFVSVPTLELQAN